MSSPGSTPLREEDRRDWQRHPVDVARLVLRLALLALVLAWTAAFSSALQNVSIDLVRLFARMPTPLRYALVGLAQLSILLTPAVLVGWFILRRSVRSLALVVGAAVAGGVTMLLLTDWLGRVAPPATITELPSSSFVQTDFPSAAYLAALVAGATAASPMITASWRRIAWGAVGVTAAIRLLTATQAPVNLLVTVVLGSAVGSAVLVVFGAPQRSPGSASLRAWLTTGGVDVRSIGDESVHSGMRWFGGVFEDRSVDIFYLDRDHRDVELFGRVIRSIRVRDVDEQRVSVLPRVRAAQWALATMMAERAGATVPAVVSVVPAPNDSAVIMLDAPSGRPLAEVGADDVADAALDALWGEVGRLHGSGMAHRALTRENLVVDGERGTLAGLDAALLGSKEPSRASDRAELLVSTAVVVGVDRALDAAVRSVDAPDLELTLPYVQIPALPTQARRDVKSNKGVVEELRAGLQERLGVEEVELAELERISIPKLVSWVGAAVLALFVLALVSNWSDISDAMAGINWVWVVPAVIVTLLGTVGGAMSLTGSVIRPIALAEATVVMFGQSFLNRFTPMNAGGMAMRIRYLQKGGTDGVVATAAVGLTSLASGVMQVVFIVFFMLWSTTDATQGLSLGDGDRGPDVSLIAVFGGAIAVAVAVVALTPKLRRWVVGFVRSTFAKVRADFGELARRPSKLMLLFGGATIGKMSTIICWVMACRAFDVDLSFAQLGALYMLANTVASAVPTPGGVGAMEAALVFVLTNAGVDEATAWASMLLFRLVNYWFPTIPGYAGLRISERRQLV